MQCVQQFAHQRDETAAPCSLPGAGLTAKPGALSVRANNRASYAAASATRSPTATSLRAATSIPTIS